MDSRGGSEVAAQFYEAHFRPPNLSLNCFIVSVGHNSPMRRWFCSLVLASLSAIAACQASYDYDPQLFLPAHITHRQDLRWVARWYPGWDEGMPKRLRKSSPENLRIAQIWLKQLPKPSFCRAAVGHWLAEIESNPTRGFKIMIEADSHNPKAPSYYGKYKPSQDVLEQERTEAHGDLVDGLAELYKNRHYVPALDYLCRMRTDGATAEGQGEAEMEIFLKEPMAIFTRCRESWHGKDSLGEYVDDLLIDDSKERPSVKASLQSILHNARTHKSRLWTALASYVETILSGKDPFANKPP